MYSCISQKASNHACKLYETIRSNGGWSNWRMDTIACFDCADLYAAKTKEQEYYISLNATLNSIEPMSLPKKEKTTVKLEKKKQKINIIKKENKPQLHRCETCNISYLYSTMLEIHMKSNKHKKCSGEHETCKYTKMSCIPCNYYTNNLYDYDKHCATRKHIRSTCDNFIKTPINEFICKTCNKMYKSRVGLWGHSKKCKTLILPEIEQSSSLPNLTNQLVEGHLRITSTAADLESFTQANDSPNTIIYNDIMYKMLEKLCLSNTECKEMIIVQQNKLLELYNKFENIHTSPVEENIKLDKEQIQEAVKK